MNLPYAGEALSVIAAILWALALVLFRRSGEQVHPIALNLFKDVLALLLYLPTVYIAGETIFHPVPAGDYWLMAVSGAIGIGIGDTLLFYSLNMLGASAYALVSAMYSPVIILLSFSFIGERLTGLQLAGALLIVTSVLEAARRQQGADAPPRRTQLWGMLLGILGVTAMGIGVVMIKPLLDTSPIFWAVEIRLFGGVAVLGLIVALHPGRKQILRSLLVRSHRGVTVWGSVIGGYLAMAAWLGGIKLTQASIASALNQTYIVFTLIFAALILRERITPMRVVAILTALIGAVMVTFG